MAGTGQNNYPVPPYPYQEQPSGEHIQYPQINQAQEREHDQKYGTSVMGAPSNPDAHPDNQSAAAGSFSSRSSGSHREEVHHNQSQPPPSVPGQTEVPYVQSTTGTSGKGNTMEQVKAQVQIFSKKAEETMNNMWSHLSTGGSESDNNWRRVAENAWGRVTAGTQILTKGGFEGVFKKTFPSTDADEKLQKTYACFLSTSTGPVSGTLFISDKRLAFCSDRPLKYLPPGKTEPAFSYYKVILPNNKVKSVIPSANQKKPAEKYIQVTTSDNFDFWYMGFVNYDKGVKNLQAIVGGSGPSTGVSHQQSFESHPPPYSQETYSPHRQQQTYPSNEQQTYPPNEQQTYPPNEQQTYPPNEQQTYASSGQNSYPHNEHNSYPPSAPAENYRRPSFSPNLYGTRP